MLITRETDYAVRTVLFLAMRRDGVANAREIAETMRIPGSFLAKILQRLVRRGLVKSTRGARGGFSLARPPSRISLFTIMEAIQGPAGINSCAVNGARCGLSRSCAVHPVWVGIRRNVEARLKRETIAKLMRR